MTSYELLEEENRRLQTDLKQMTQMVEAAKDAMISFDEAGRITFVNTAAEQLFGYSRTEILECDFSILIPIEHVETHIKEYTLKLEEMVDERTRELQRSEEMYRSIFNNAPVGIFTFDREGVVISMNRYHQDLNWGGDFSDSLGKYNLLTAPFEKEQGFDTLFRNLLEKGEQFEFFGRNITTEVNGFSPADHYISRAVPLRDSEGTIVGGIFIQQDLTEMVKLEKELQEAEDRYRTIFEKAPVGIFSIDKQGFVTAINPYQLEVDGGEPEDFIGKFNTLGYSQINNPYMYEKFSEMLEGRPFEVKDLLNNTPEGNQIYINMSGNPVFDTEGNCIGGILMMEDVTERVHLQERLLRTEKLAAIGKLASGVGHELRNPLGVIKNSVYFLKMVLGSSDEKVGRHLEIQNREIDISNRIITILMEFSKLRSSNVESFDMNSLIMESLSKIDIPDNVELELELEEGRIDIVADRVQIGGVLINIITNAVQAMPLGGRLKIGIERMGGFIRIEVVDTGEGMSEETVKDIFEPLYTTKAKGIGLGLAIARQYVENHNGKIGVKSKPGKGSVFSIKLPLRKS